MRGVRGVLPAERFAFFENELRRLAEARWRADHPDADNVPAKELNCPQRDADALVDMALRSRELGDNNDEPLGSHVDVMILIDRRTLTDGLHEHSRCELDDTTPLPPSAARRLLCDADILTAIGDPAALRDAETPQGVLGTGVLAGGDRKSWNLDLGYSRRSANRKIRKALIARDRTCTAPGFGRPNWMCEIHHIVSWADGGRTDLNNLTLLCNRHRHLHHANQTRRTNGAARPGGKGYRTLPNSHSSVSTGVNGVANAGGKGDPPARRGDPPSGRGDPTGRPTDPGTGTPACTRRPDPPLRQERTPGHTDPVTPRRDRAPDKPHDPAPDSNDAHTETHGGAPKDRLPRTGVPEQL